MYTTLYTLELLTNIIKYRHKNLSGLEYSQLFWLNRNLPSSPSCQTCLFVAVTSQPIALRPMVGDVNVLDGHHKS